MFRYICMPKLVAFYLREFSIRNDEEVSLLYKFVFCLCLPFISNKFREARLRSLAIAECTQSVDQITKLIKQFTGVDITITEPADSYMTSYDGSDDGAGDDSMCFPYEPSTLSNTDNPIVPFIYPYNDVDVNIQGIITLQKRAEVEAYLQLLIPFYVKYTIKINLV